MVTYFGVVVDKQCMLVECWELEVNLFRKIELINVDMKKRLRFQVLKISLEGIDKGTEFGYLTCLYMQLSISLRQRVNRNSQQHLC